MFRAIPVARLLVLSAAFLSFQAQAAETFKIRWLLAHDPVKAFDDAAQKFKSTVEKRTNGNVTVQITTLKEAGLNGELSQAKSFEMLKSGEFEMCQTFGTFLGTKNPKFWVFDMPFLFRDYKHAERVITGPIGKEILATLEKENLKGMAITYSGGFRVIPANNRKITKLEDLHGLKLRVPQYASVASAFYEKLGATALPMSPESAAQAQSNDDIDGQETTLPRFWELEKRDATRVVNDTGHSLYVTALVLNKTFFDSLPENYRAIVLDAAREAATVERADAIKLGEDLKKEIVKQGMSLETLSEKEKARFKKASASVYEDFEPIVGKELIQKVRNTK